MAREGDAGLREEDGGGGGGVVARLLREQRQRVSYRVSEQSSFCLLFRLLVPTLPLLLVNHTALDPPPPGHHHNAFRHARSWVLDNVWSSYSANKHC